MPSVSRRGLLSGSVAVGAALSIPATATAATGTASSGTASVGGGKVLPNDARYQDLVLRGTNRRFVGKPEYVRVIRSTEDAVQAVQEAVRSGKRIAVRGGGHCYEDFVDNSEVEVLIDMSQYDEVTFDEQYRAFSIGAGAILETVYKALFYGWGVTVPGGGCLGVGVGGHFSGGGYGPLSRQHGSVVDHLYGVEVVVVDAHGRARSVVATRDNRYSDLWWAHTGGGGGNFGVVTRYLMRTAGATGSDPAKLLPKAPAALLSSILLYDWKTITQAGFVRTVRNFFDFFEQHNTADSPYATLYSPLILTPVKAGNLLLSTQLDASVPDAANLMKAFNAAMVAGVDPAPQLIDTGEGPFLHTTIQRSIAEDIAPNRNKYKAGYLRKGYTDAQLETIYKHLADPEAKIGTSSSILLVPYGGKVNTVAPSATATVQRDVVAKMVLTATWDDPAQDADGIAWARSLYSDLYRELYYQDNYPRLQRVKARWDPRNVFRHKLSIEPA